MISVNEAEKLIAENLPNRVIKLVNLVDASGKILAEDVISPIASPTYTNSAMDGFAVRWADLETKKPLKIIGESCAGVPFSGKTKSKEAGAINTGAMVPNGMDTVIPIENCEVSGEFAQIMSAKKQGQHIRLKGEEFAKGDILLNKNTKIQAQQIGLLATVGISKISVFTPPNVAIIVTGEELVPFEKPCEAHQLLDCNTPMLRTILQENGIAHINSFRVGDSLKSTIETLENAIRENQIIIFSGGVSVGEHDFVKDAAKSVGFTEVFWKVRQKPGKPLYFAKKGEQLLFGLPGNPVSAFMGFVHYVAPVLQKLQGFSDEKPRFSGKINRNIENQSDRTQFLRVHLNKSTDKITLLQKQGSHMLTSVANASGYIRVEPKQKIEENDKIEVVLF